MRNITTSIKRFLPFLLAAALLITGCDKSEVNKKTPEVLPVTEAVKTGDWMVTYFENNASMDLGLTFIKFNTGGTLVATKDGTNFNGTWKETNAEGNNTVAINITTADVRLLKVNRTWKVVNIAEFFIDLKDPDVTSKSTVQLMKH